MYVYIIYNYLLFYKCFEEKKEVIFMANKRSRGNGEGTIFKRKIRGKEVWVCEYTIRY